VRPVALPLLCVLVASAWSGPAAAQDAAAEARARFSAGQLLFEQGDTPAALTEFRAAMRIEPHDATRFNVAACLQRLGRFVEAAGEYDAAAASPQLSEAVRARAADLAARVRERVATLRLVEAPVGASVEVDGRAACTDCDLTLDPGEHRVSVEAAGHLPAAHTIELGSGERRTLSASLVPEAVAAPAPAALPSGGHTAGVVSVLGGAIAALGLGAAIGLSVAAGDAHQRYLAGPSSSLRDEGLALQSGSHVAIGIASAGALAVVTDLVLAAALGGQEPRGPTTDRGVVRF
jgi:hypothetical protein